MTQCKERLAETQRCVFAEIKKRLDRQHNLPHAVVNLINDGWKDVLLFAGLREGVGSYEWQDALLLMDKLIWSIEPKADSEDRQILLNDIPDLLKGLREGLNAISFDPRRTNHIFREIQNCHVSALHGDTGHMTQAEIVTETMVTHHPRVDRPENYATEDPILGDHQIVDTEEIQDKSLDQAKTLAIGTWIEVKEEGYETTKRIRLAWKSDVTGMHLFVNRKGIKVAELNLQALVAWLRSGNTNVLKDLDVPLMKRAVNTMLSA